MAIIFEFLETVVRYLSLSFQCFPSTESRMRSSHMQLGSGLHFRILRQAHLGGNHPWQRAKLTIMVPRRIRIFQRVHS
jgi:hypothetical protein